MSKALSIKVFSDGAVLETMLHDLNSGLVTGFTTNPSLMKKAGITSYIGFAKDVLKEITDYPRGTTSSAASRRGPRPRTITECRRTTSILS